MVNPITRFEAVASPFGSEVDLNWDFPVTLPANYKYYIFQRSGSDVDQVNDIDRYFQNINNLTNYNYDGCFVFDQLNPLGTSLGIYQVLNGLKYYYKIVIRDETSGEYSTAVGANVTPDFEVAVNIVDGKEITARAFEKMLESLTNKEGKKISKSKDIEIVKAWSFDEVKDDLFVIERANGSNNQRFWGDILDKHGSSLTEGDFDVDVIRITFLTIAGNVRRDLMANLVRSRKIFFRSFLKKLGAIDVAITIEGDMGYAPPKGEAAIGFTVVFAELIAVLNKIEQAQALTHTLTTMQVKTDNQTINYAG